jgi:CheY-like chemotaxis protein
MSKSILIVDDDLTSLEVMSTILKQETNFKVETVDTGKKCLEHIKHQKPDLILLDVMLPDIAGTDVCVQIKEQPNFADVIIILLSGIKVKKEDYIFGLEIGADDYLSRPFDSEKLIARIISIFRLKDTIVKSREAIYEPFDRQGTSQTAATYEQQLIKDAYPDVHKEMIDKYNSILNTAIKERLYKVENTNAKLIKKLATELGFLKAGARDIIDIHKEALKFILNQQSAKRAFLIKEESRIVLLELMGYLLNFYRNKS